MTKYEEIYFIGSLLAIAKTDQFVELNEQDNLKKLFLSKDTQIHEDYLFTLNDKGILYYEEIGEEGFKPIIMCSVKPETTEYLKHLLIDMEKSNSKDRKEIEELNKRITEILTFNPQKLSDEIKLTENIIYKTKEQLKGNPILEPLQVQLEQVELHFNSLRRAAFHYEDVYKNIILPVREEGKLGVRQTVRWAIISIVISTLFSLVISWLSK